MGGLGKAHQGVGRIIRGRSCVYLECLTPFCGENRPHCASVGIHMLRPASQMVSGAVVRRPSMHGYAFSHWVLQVRDRKRGARREALVIYPTGMDPALQGLAIVNLVSRIARDAIAGSRQRN